MSTPPPLETEAVSLHTTSSGNFRRAGSPASQNSADTQRSTASRVLYARHEGSNVSLVDPEDQSVDPSSLPQVEIPRETPPGADDVTMIVAPNGRVSAVQLTETNEAANSDVNAHAGADMAPLGGDSPTVTATARTWTWENAKWVLGKTAQVMGGLGAAAGAAGAGLATWAVVHPTQAVNVANAAMPGVAGALAATAGAANAVSKYDPKPGQTPEENATLHHRNKRVIINSGLAVTGGALNAAASALGGVAEKGAETMSPVKVATLRGAAVLAAYVGTIAAGAGQYGLENIDTFRGMLPNDLYESASPVQQSSQASLGQRPPASQQAAMAMTPFNAAPRVEAGTATASSSQAGRPQPHRQLGIMPSTTGNAPKR